MCFYGYRNLNWYKQYHQDPTYPKPHPTGNSKLIILAAIAKMPPIHKNTFDAIPQLINPSPHPIKGSIHSPDLLSQQRTNMISDPAS